ncbi:MAG: hypothetical protein ACM3PP_05805 [Candidatus Saccharibacteria bacterium]
MRKKAFVIISLLALITASCLGLYIYRSFSSVSEMFRLNGKLQAEGYYMAEFEFKMLACAYYLDHGHYREAFTKLNNLHDQLITRKGLVKVPSFANKAEEIQFYLSLQNPKTGAFMDDSYPAIFYFEPTLNVVEHLEQLAKETGQPLRLKYPLTFMKRFDSPQELREVLDDLSTVGWIGSKLPKTNYMMASCYRSYDVLERNHLYEFSPAWKHELLRWFYYNQDSMTGYWGPRLRYSGELLNGGELSPTYKIVTMFKDQQGNSIYPEFPARYQDRILKTTLQKIAEPMPEDSDAEEIHEWQLTRYHGLKLLTWYLWQDLTREHKNEVARIMERLITNKYEKFYVKNQGAFSYYPGSKESTLDGTGDMVGLLDLTGALSAERQKLLWVDPNKGVTDLGMLEVADPKNINLAALENIKGINSVRVYVYQGSNEGLPDGLLCIAYPHKTNVLDTTDLLPKMKQWLLSTSQNMGNWQSKETILRELGSVPLQQVPVYQGNIQSDSVGVMLRNNQLLTVVGFDILQRPKCRAVIRLH